MDDKQFEVLLNAINKLTTAIEDVGNKIASDDNILERTINDMTTAIELK